MISVELVDNKNKKQVDEFIKLPWKIYKGYSLWVPPIISDVKIIINRKKHPFFEHSEGDFFLARKDGEVVGRVCVAENKPFNQVHNVKKVQFYFFESIDDQEVANALFERIFEWARARGLNEVVGPKGFSAFDGYGIQIEGFEHHQMMTMMNFNPEYYVRLIENIGFQKEVDFVSCYIKAADFKIPEKIHLVAEKVKERGKFQVKTFTTKKELRAWGKRIGDSYNQTFVNNWEYYPLTKHEIDYVIDNIMTLADPRLIKIITYEDKVIGFLFGFPDVSKSLQRANGRLNLFTLIDILRDMKKTNWVSLNGAGILPEYQGRGGNALMYAEMDKTIHDYGYDHYELTQVAETTVQMRRDLITVGGLPYKNHRIYHRAI